MSDASSKPKAKKSSFSSFSLMQAYKQLNLTKLTSWTIQTKPLAPSEFFEQRLERLKRFDLRIYEESRKLLIDAICEEGLQGFTRLKIWKGASLETNTVAGYVDYVVTDDRDYLEAPFLCIVEAKRDDFEQGLAQCLIEMQACQQLNQHIGRSIEVFGIVTNGEAWKFYKLTTSNAVYETILYSLQDISTLLGVLQFILEQCERNLLQTA
ncbi:MAG: hypothetical protein HC865_12415 [Cyanobacteria bacterium RU_5_0]|nr:hypothetical protein [Cyanobacteria bacterium RU_5_0]